MLLVDWLSVGIVALDQAKRELAETQRAERVLALDHGRTLIAMNAEMWDKLEEITANHAQNTARMYISNILKQAGEYA